MNGWFKFHRKLIEHELFFDDKAYRLFTWILSSVNYDTGKMTVGRFWAAKHVRLKPTTFYKALKRLSEKYFVISLKSDNKKTEISVLNWAKYQSVDERVTTKGQQKDNKVTHTKEIKKERSKEYIYNNDIMKNLPEEKTTTASENYKADALSDLKKSLGVPEKQGRGVYTDYQAEALRIVNSLGISHERISSYVKAVKDNSRSLILQSYGFVVDYPNKTPKDKDKLFFWKLNQLRK